MGPANPYDELPYPSLPIEWSAPERLALASALHAGPRAALDGYRVLELGCGDGANLLPLAHYRQQATFVGIDGSAVAIEIAKRRQSLLSLENVQLVHADFRQASDRVEGPFDFILAHGVFSWVPDRVRDELLALCGRHLRPGGLLYLNYNSLPGWNVRGMVRDCLLAETAAIQDLRAKAKRAQKVAAELASSLATAGDHPYSRLLGREFQFVCDGHPAYIAHEFLAAENHAYWRRDFLALAGKYGLEYVADADFNYSSGRIGQGLAEQILRAGIGRQSVDDTVDLLSYRQLHSPILTRGPWTRRPLEAAEFGTLFVASPLESLPKARDGRTWFRHPNGFEVEAKDDTIRDVLDHLHASWPRGRRIDDLFPSVPAIVDDLRLLHHHGLIDLRLVEPGDFRSFSDPTPLNRLEAEWGGYRTTARHTREAPDLPPVELALEPVPKKDRP